MPTSGHATLFTRRVPFAPFIPLAFILCAAAPLTAQVRWTESFSPLVLGYRYSFGDGVSGHHLSIGMGSVGAVVYDSIGGDAGSRMVSGSVEIGLVHGRLVIAPTFSGYIAGGLAIGGNLSLAFDGRHVAFVLRPALGVGLFSADGDGAVLTYEYALTLPWDQDLAPRNSGVVVGALQPFR